MSPLVASELKRRRGMMLELVYTNHRQQLHHLDDVRMWGLLTDLGCTIGQNDVLTLLQEMGERGYLTYKEASNRLTGRTEISRIQITPSGRDLVERTNVDPAVLIP